MKYLRYFLFLILLCSSLFSLYSDVSQSINATNEAYWYLYNQQYFSNRIIVRFPELRNDMEKALNKFDKTFGNAQVNLEKEMKEKLGDNYDQIIDAFSERAIELYSKTNYYLESSRDFINSINEAADGNIESSIKKTLFNYQYLDQPEKEILDGHTYYYKIGDNPDAQGVEMGFYIPESWEIVDYDKPNLIVKFSNNNGYGNIDLMVGVMGIPQYDNFKKSNLSNHDFFDQLSNYNIMPENSEFHSRRNVIIDNTEALEFEYVSFYNPLGVISENHIIGFMTIIDEYILEVKFIVEDFQGKRDLAAQYDKYMKLFRLVFDSVEFP